MSEIYLYNGKKVEVDDGYDPELDGMFSNDGFFIDEDEELEKNGATDAEDVVRRNKLYTQLMSMSQEERDLFFKSLQLDATTDMLEAIKNLKKTPGEMWQHVIEKLKNVADLPVSDEEKKKFDFGKFVKTLLPLLGALAGTLLAIRQAEKEEIKSEMPEDVSNGNEQSPLKRVQNELEDIAKEQKEKNSSSIVLQLARENKENFSL